MTEKYPPEMKQALCEAALPLIAEGKTLMSIAKSFGVMRHKLGEWLQATPEASEHYARARDSGWDAMAEELYAMVMDSGLDPKDRRIRLEGGLRLLARWCPARYGEAVLLKHEVTHEVEELTSEQMVAALAEMLTAKPPALPAPVEGEWTDVPS